jgi:hypothetical protein
MTLNTLPPELLIRQESWMQTDARIVQRSVFTGRTTELILGPSARWTCTADIADLTAAQMQVVRGFLAGMAMPGAYTIIGPVPEAGQQTGMAGASATALVNGTGQLGYTLAIDGLTPSTLHLRRGQFINFGSTSGFAQMSVLRADLTANASGQAVAQLSNPIRQPPADNSIVHLNAPFVWMRLQNPMQFINALATMHQIPPLQFEETF